MIRSVKDARALFAYERWAANQFFDAVLALPPGVADRELGGSFASIRATLLHLIGAEFTWVSRWEGGDGALPKGWDDQELVELRGAADRVALRQDQVLDRLEALEAGGDPNALGGELRYGDRSGAPRVSTFGDMILHVVNHGSYHRGQLATLLRQVGAVPPSTDYIKYTRRSPGG